MRDGIQHIRVIYEAARDSKSEHSRLLTGCMDRYNEAGNMEWRVRIAICKQGRLAQEK